VRGEDWGEERGGEMWRGWGGGGVKREGDKTREMKRGGGQERENIKERKEKGGGGARDGGRNPRKYLAE